MKLEPLDLRRYTPPYARPQIRSRQERIMEVICTVFVSFCMAAFLWTIAHDFIWIILLRK